ncbi:MAG: FixH family protein [Myxococcota bacterium]
MWKAFKEKGLQWPLLIVAILGSSVIANIAVVVRASSDPSFVIEEDYYENALNWDVDQEAQRQSDALGWAIEADARIAAADPSQIELDVRVADAQGRPVQNAQVFVKAFAIARSADVVGGAVPAVGTAYRGTLDAARPGLWELDFKVQAGPDVYLQRVRTDVYVR